MLRKLAPILVLVLLAAQAAWCGAQVRRTSAAGPLYPLEPQTLRSTLHRLFGQVEAPAPQERLVACIVPHDGYGLCGDIAAHAFKNLKPGQYKRVIILAPADYHSFEGCSIAAVQAYVTPLGFVPLDIDVIRELTRAPLISARSVRYDESKHHIPLHEDENTIEVVLPFLQEKLGLFKLVPILVGNLKDARNHYDPERIDAVAGLLRPYVDDKTLVVVSTNLTHYGNDFSYRPFEQNIEQRIERLDKQAVDLILDQDSQGFQNYLEQTGNPICGHASIQVLFRLLPHPSEGVMLAYSNSLRKTGYDKRSVSYVAIDFYDPTKPPAESDPSVPQLPPFDPTATAKSGAATPQSPEETKEQAAPQQEEAPATHD